MPPAAALPPAAACLDVVAGGEHGHVVVLVVDLALDPVGMVPTGVQLALSWERGRRRAGALCAASPVLPPTAAAPVRLAGGGLGGGKQRPVGVQGRVQPP